MYLYSQPRVHLIVQLRDEVSGRRVAELELVESRGTLTVAQISVLHGLTAGVAMDYLSAVRRLLEDAVRVAKGKQMTLQLATSMQGMDALLTELGFGRAGTVWDLRGDRRGGTESGGAVSGPDVGGARPAGGGCLDGLAER